MRWFGMVLVLLSPGMLVAQTTSRSEQANTLLLWEDRMDLQPTSTYEATITSVVNGQSVRRTQAVVPYASAECQVVASVRGELWTPDTLCADLCLPVGETTVALTASTPGWLNPSASSNEAHSTLTQPCGPPAPPRPSPPPPSASSLPSWAIGAGALAVSGAVAVSGSSPSLPSLVNPRCVTWRITGPCLCGLTPCLTVEYFEPTYLIEIVKQPGTTALPILGDLLKAGLRAMGVSLFGGGGAGNSAGAGHTNLHYSETHVWSFPQIFGSPCTGCAPVNALPRLLYASEADTASWRITTAPPGLPVPAHLLVGTWGPLFPRVGYAIHSSPVVAAALKAFRGMNIAFLPVTGPPTPEAHVILNPATDLSACMQSAWPKQTPCILAGTPSIPPLAWDAGASSVTGAYIFVAWSKRSCCVPPPGTCGITIPPLGLHGENMCPM